MLQFIVLLSIMAIWALTSLLSREAQPLPPRPTRGPAPDGTRPNLVGRTTELGGAGRDPGAANRPAGGLPDRNPMPRWSDAAPAPRTTPARPAAADDGIVVVDSDARGSRSAPGSFGSPTSGAGSRTSRANLARRGGRGRSSSAPGPVKTAESGRPRALTSQVTESMAQKRNRPLEITPLSSPLSLNDSPLTKLSTRQPADKPGFSTAAPSMTAATVHTMLATSSKLREIMLLSEILQPPVSVRNRRRPH